MKNQINIPVNFDVKLDSETTYADSLEQLVERIKLIQSRHPDAKFNLGAVVVWWTIQNP